MKWCIKRVGPSVLRDSDGMNYQAARAMGFKGYPMKRNTILVDKRFGPKRMRETVLHEKLEAALMAKGKGYWDAHRYALKHQNGK